MSDAHAYEVLQNKAVTNTRPNIAIHWSPGKMLCSCQRTHTYHVFFMTCALSHFLYKYAHWRIRRGIFSDLLLKSEEIRNTKIESWCFAKNMFFKKGTTGLLYERVKRNSYTKCRQCWEVDFFLTPQCSILDLACLIFHMNNPQRLTWQTQHFWSKPTTSKAESHHSRWYIHRSEKKLICAGTELTTERYCPLL